jgi:hypothetical protein
MWLDVGFATSVNRNVNVRPPSSAAWLAAATHALA